MTRVSYNIAVLSAPACKGTAMPFELLIPLSTTILPHDRTIPQRTLRHAASSRHGTQTVRHARALHRTAREGRYALHARRPVAQRIHHAAQGTGGTLPHVLRGRGRRLHGRRGHHAGRQAEGAGVRDGRGRGHSHSMRGRGMHREGIPEGRGGKEMAGAAKRQVRAHTAGGGHERAHPGKSGGAHKAGPENIARRPHAKHLLQQEAGGIHPGTEGRKGKGHNKGGGADGEVQEALVCRVQADGGLRTGGAGHVHHIRGNGAACRAGAPVPANGNTAETHGGAKFQEAGDKVGHEGRACDGSTLRGIHAHRTGNGAGRSKDVSSICRRRQKKKTKSGLRSTLQAIHLADKVFIRTFAGDLYDTCG